ncbi:DUF4893 domain-containing protein [Sphingomonas sp. 3P27F8]|uniref:DUF4893 domain-containing protein n=1 Tax=Sphingomonas sp. 3P27F8 TaxID=2502213 RepID=UPI0010F815B7|nr:DUF4893 domain-containing protein [Sphingomonas sp. 3P27F8]
MGLLVALAAVAACQAGAVGAVQIPPQEAEAVVREHTLPDRAAKCGGVESAWRQASTQRDRERLRNWRTTWLDAVARAKAGGGGEAIARDEMLYDPDRALDNPIIPAGNYRCRIIKLGAKRPVNRNFVELPAARCTVGQDDGETWFTVNDGTQRPIGRFFAGPPGRGVFLGTLELGDERLPLEYGVDAKRNMIAYLDRIGEARWRLIVPEPQFDAVAELVEITPER